MMKRLTLLLWVAGLFILGLSSLHAQTGGPFLPSAADNRCRQWVDSVLSGLNVHEKVGQLIVATIPARADKATKKQMRELVKKYKVGGLLFSEGTPEEQAILTNMARKDAKIPVMVTFDGEWGLSMRLKGAPDYPRNAALGCIEDNGLIEEYIIRKSKFPQNPKRSVRFSGKRTKRSVQKRKARNTQKAETKVL